MNISQAGGFRKERGSELVGLADVLVSEGLIRSGDPLREAAGACTRPELNRTLRWGYVLDGLIFELNDVHLAEIRHTQPRGLSYLEVELTVVLSGDCLDDGATTDPLDLLEVNIELHGICGDGAQRSAWHLDRHIGKEHSGFAHPLYHFQYGGKRVRDIEQHGEHLLVESPRLAHPPLDAVLAIDFILSNFFYDVWFGLRNRHAFYSDTVREAQRRFWRPYALASAWLWAPMPDSIDWKAPPLWPQIVSKQIR